MVSISKLRAFPSRTISSIRERLSSASVNRNRGFIGVPAGAGGPPGFFPPQLFRVTENGGASGDNYFLAARRISDRLVQVLNTGGGRYMAPREVEERYNIQFSDGIREGHVDRLGPKLFEEALNILRFNLSIEENDQGLRLFNQVSRINEVASSLNARLLHLNNLHDLVRRVMEAGQEFPENLDLYFYDQQSRELIKAGSNSPARYTSNYTVWQPVREGGVLDMVINPERYREKAGELVHEIKGTGFRLTKYAKNEGPVFLEDLQKYTEAFKDPDEVRFQRGRDESERVVLVTKRHNWKARTEEGGNLRLYSKNNGSKEVDAAWDAFDQVIASAIGRIIQDQSVKSVWREEEREIEAMRGETRGSGQETQQTQEARLFALAKKRGNIKRIGKHIEVARLFPTSLVETAELSEKSDFVRGLDWTGRSKEDLRKHLLEAAEVAVVFFRGKPISFASVEESNFNNDRSFEMILTMVGTMVHKDYYGLRLQTYMYFQLMFRRWLRYKFMGGFFKPLRPIMRTRSVGAAAGFLEHFSNVKYSDLSPAERRRADEYSERMGCRCDQDGVVVNAYDKSPRDRERDEVLLAKIKKNKPALYRRVNEAIGELPETHARIFQGKWTFWRIFSDWLYVRFVLTPRLAKFKLEEN